MSAHAVRNITEGPSTVDRPQELSFLRGPATAPGESATAGEAWLLVQLQPVVSPSESSDEDDVEKIASMALDAARHRDIISLPHTGCRGLNNVSRLAY